MERCEHEPHADARDEEEGISPRGDPREPSHGPLPGTGRLWGQLRLRGPRVLRGRLLRQLNPLPFIHARARALSELRIIADNRLPRIIYPQGPSILQEEAEIRTPWKHRDS